MLQAVILRWSSEAR